MLDDGPAPFGVLVLGRFFDLLDVFWIWLINSMHSVMILGVLDVFFAGLFIFLYKFCLVFSNFFIWFISRAILDALIFQKRLSRLSFS